MRVTQQLWRVGGSLLLLRAVSAGCRAQNACQSNCAMRLFEEDMLALAANTRTHRLEPEVQVQLCSRGRCADCLHNGLCGRLLGLLFAAVWRVNCKQALEARTSSGTTQRTQPKEGTQGCARQISSRCPRPPKIKIPRLPQHHHCACTRYSQLPPRSLWPAQRRSPPKMPASSWSQSSPTRAPVIL